jgi:cysteine-rich repeat protein
MAALPACPSPDEGFDSFSGSATAQPTATTAAVDTGESSTSSDAPDTSSSTIEPADGSSSSSSAGEVPVCGNATVELGEQCDDGNDVELDTCTTTCTVPRCDDGVHDGDETDLDCGGSCQGCELCLGCVEPDDCAPSLACSDEGRCVVHEVMSVHWVANCGGIAQGHTVEGLPLGSYVATALPSAGTLWLPPFTPPSTGYFYEIQCAGGVILNQLRTPPGVRYASVATAFAAITEDTQEFDFLGGDLTCFRNDDTCADNNGTVEFSIDYVCDSN